MPISFNHTIVAARDKRESAEFLAELFGLPSPKAFGHFMVVALEHGAILDYADAPEARRSGRSTTRSWFPRRTSTRSTARSNRAGCSTGRIPGAQRPGEINQRDGGRGVYFLDPAGHAMEILTRPYGSGG